MKTTIIKNHPALTLTGNSYTGAIGGDVDVSWDELKNSPIGTKWDGPCADCGRDVYEESCTLVYRDEDGAAVVHHSWGTTDSDNPESFNNEPELIWFEF